jgi:hypothetical protein
MSLSQILAAMMQSSVAPQVTPMGAAPSGGGGGGGVTPIKGGSLDMNFGGGQRAQPPMPTMMDIQEKYGLDPASQPDIYGLNAPDTTALARQMYEATEEAYRLNNPAGFGDWWDAQRGGAEKARERVAQAQQNIASFKQQQAYVANEMAKAKAQADQENLYYSAADAVYGMTQDKDLAHRVGTLMTTDPQSGRQIIDQLAQQAYPEPKAGTTINLPPEYPKPPAGHWWKNPEEAAKGDYSSGIVNLADVPKETERRSDVIDSAALITKHTQSIRDEMDKAVLPTTGGGGALVRKATQFLDDPNKEGEVGKFTRFTSAGEIDALLEPIKSKIGLQTINQMRKMSETGGALGNVSNFEVRVVQAAIDSLDPNRGEEGFREALDNVDTAFKRAAFVARWGDDIIEEAKELGVDEFEYFQQTLNERFPINEGFMEEINLRQDEFDEMDRARDEKKEANDGWSIKRID